MAKVTSKLQLTLPKRLAEQFGIVPGDDVDFEAAGDVIRLIPPGARARTALNSIERLRLFDEDTAEQRERERALQLPPQAPARRDWSREDLYTRGDSRDDALDEPD
ncbi:MAG: AbrB/MazE/SpoVT family DNA-binding domain-containing protein [Gammaproteobacteria bacterium]|nr:AbrB/MazE/SpoVT family DNA-binding domain-containing protein [Gammaproteobacteria bacterium]